MNHDVRARQSEHDKLAKNIAEFEKTQKIEVIPFGVVSDHKFAWSMWHGKTLFGDSDDD